MEELIQATQILLFYQVYSMINLIIIKIGELKLIVLEKKLQDIQLQQIH